MIIGILGGGQLARMLALAGYRLGLSFRVLDPADDACAGQVAPLTVGRCDDEHTLSDFALGLDAVTYEFENVPVATARWLAQRVPALPPPEALERSQDRLVEKRLFVECGLETPAFEPVDSPDQLRAALERIGLPAVLKTRRFGYDGKGQALLRTAEDVDAAWARLGGQPLILEQFVPFEREVSLLAVRGRRGETAFYPLVENEHAGGILRCSRVPARGAPAELEAHAQACGRALLEELDYVGVLAIEFFVHGGRLLASEIAPRVHNSGHWTIEGAATSQFEDHLRAILGLPLGDTSARWPSAMVNLVGWLPAPADALAQPGAHLHVYGKAVRPGRKVGHVTIVAPTDVELERRLAQVRAAIQYA